MAQHPLVDRACGALFRVGGTEDCSYEGKRFPAHFVAKLADWRK
jgi:hypothetical protein